MNQKYPCSQCGETFMTEVQLQQHMSEKHTDETSGEEHIQEKEQYPGTPNTPTDESGRPK